MDANNLVHAWSSALATQAVVVPSLDQNPEYETAANLWTFQLTLTEEAGIASTITGLTINGSAFTAQQIQSLFGTTAIRANGSVSGSYSLRNLDVSSGPVPVVFTFSGMDANNNAWNNSMTVPFAGLAPVLELGGVSNSANGQQTFAPGQIVSLYGTGMGSLVQSAAAATLSPLPEYLGGVTIYVYNLSGSASYLAPLYYVSPTQVNFQLPYELSPGPTEMQVFTSWNSDGLTLDFTVSTAAPGIFSYADTSTNPSPIGSGSARVGDTVAIYVTGEGSLAPPMADGFAPSPNVVPVPQQKVSVTVGGVPVTNFPYLGIPSWSAGVLQINFAIPSGVATGKQPVVVTVGGAQSLPAAIAITQ